EEFMCSGNYLMTWRSWLIAAGISLKGEVRFKRVSCQSQAHHRTRCDLKLLLSGQRLGSRTSTEGTYG
ncbi:hypothetical protein N8568_01950, partial [bacterium]|nr:hypothetical protein [bacterium]